MDKQEMKFKLSHTALYAKGWYESSDDIFEDLKIAFTMDGFSGELFRKKDITEFLIRNCNKIDIRHFDLYEFVNGIRPKNTFKIGYYHNQTQDIFKPKNTKGDYDYDTAIVHYCLSGLRLMELEMMFAKTPDYTKGFEMPKHLSEKRVKEVFG